MEKVLTGYSADTALREERAAAAKNGQPIPPVTIGGVEIKNPVWDEAKGCYLAMSHNRQSPLVPLVQIYR